MSTIVMLLIIFAVMLVVGIMGFVASYDHEGSGWQVLFITITIIGSAGFIVCFIIGIIMLIAGGVK